MVTRLWGPLNQQVVTRHVIRKMYLAGGGALEALLTGQEPAVLPSTTPAPDGSFPRIWVLGLECFPAPVTEGVIP